VTAPFGRAVVVGGRGAVGALLVDRLVASGVASVVAIDRSPATSTRPGVEEIVGDPLTDRAGVDPLGRADLVVLALPEEAALALVPLLAELLAPDCLVVDTLSVKTGFAAAAAEFGRPALGINPMFAPDLGFAGQVVAVVGGSDERLARLLGEWGARTVALSADEHDGVTALLQAATHAAVLGLGLAIEASGMPVETLLALAPPPHRTLLGLLARMGEADPEVYRDIQHGNPAAGRARSHLVAGIGELERASADPDEFAALFERVRSLLGPARTELVEQCRAAFALLSAPQQK
jgi:4-amino-4-deoxyprephenate dehydrogenase